MAIEKQRFGTVGRDHLDGAVCLKGVAQIDQTAVDLSGQRGLREPRRDRRGDVDDCRAGRHISTGSVRKRDRYLTHYWRLGGTANGRHGWTRTTDLLRVKQAL